MHGSYSFIFSAVFFQRLLPVNMVNELSPEANTGNPNHIVYTIRPYLETDKVVYFIRQGCDSICLLGFFVRSASELLHGKCVSGVQWMFP